VEFDVAEDFLGDFVAYRAVERDEHGFGKGQGHESLYYRVVVTDKRHEILGFRAEAESNRKLEEEADMEIAEIGLDRIQHEDVPFTPFEKALFRGSVLDHAIDHLAHEHGHGILEHVAADPEERVAGDQIPGCKQCGFVGLDDIGLQHVQRQEKRHHGFLSRSLYKKASPPIFPAQGMDDERILTELGGKENYEFGVFGHTIRFKDPSLRSG